ncbi:hypothetical protein FZZ93_02230 [Halomonas eurihalina]|uniref:Uncharacterized protein n=1 Tax=Halomonas eurihalina TaxID=42566 RepID=A0A5D9DE05_HALER|nr:hypothetical protein [Halomonas eurihalina]MDR5857987.1 hypothetical protein [Halomonas eurihalina]TZG41502.1 hypothetical protein FZZ93_02230 [Halomonas eurihalina]
MSSNATNSDPVSNSFRVLDNSEIDQVAGGFSLADGLERLHEIERGIQERAAEFNQKLHKQIAMGMEELREARADITSAFGEIFL